MRDRFRQFNLHRLRWAMAIAALALTWGMVASPAQGGEYNTVLNIGDAAPAWNDLPGVDDRTHSLADLRDKEVVIVVFTCNSCPVAADYEDRIIELAKKFGGSQARAEVVAINVNRIEEDRLPKMKERAGAKGFPFAYLYDDSQEIAKAFGATYTPEFFVLDRERRVVYMGGMDDNSNSREVKENFLVPAVEAALAGQAPKPAETPARGCTIRYQRRRK